MFINIHHQPIKINKAWLKYGGSISIPQPVSHLPDPDKSMENTETSCGSSTGNASKA
jgi:hypothetical protein